MGEVAALGSFQGQGDGGVSIRSSSTVKHLHFSEAHPWSSTRKAGKHGKGKANKEPECEQRRVPRKGNQDTGGYSSKRIKLGPED